MSRAGLAAALLSLPSACWGKPPSWGPDGPCQLVQGAMLRDWVFRDIHSSKMFSTIVTIPKNTASLCIYLIFPLVYPISLLVLRLGAAPPLT